MSWALAGDDAFDSAKGEDFIGQALTGTRHKAFKTASSFQTCRLA